MPNPFSWVDDCPKGWEYKDHKNYNKEVMKRREARALKSIRINTADKNRNICKDTRRIHRDFFFDLAPDRFPYYAGHYRGENFRCLIGCRVQVGGDARVGHAPHMVQYAMVQEAVRIDSAIQALEFIRTNSAWYSQRQLLVRTAKVAAAVFVKFLEVHPYVNGNGHMGRFILNTIMGMFGFWLSRFPVHQRPFDDYAKLIVDYRNGQTRGLELFIISCV